MWQFASRIRSKQHEPCDEFRVDPIRLGTRASAGGECFDLRGWQLPGRDPGSVEGGSQSPFLPASSLEANQRTQFESELSDLLVTLSPVRQPRALAFRQAVKVQPVAADIYADDAAM